MTDKFIIVDKTSASAFSEFWNTDKSRGLSKNLLREFTSKTRSSSPHPRFAILNEKSWGWCPRISILKESSLDQPPQSTDLDSDIRYLNAACSNLGNPSLFNPVDWVNSHIFQQYQYFQLFISNIPLVCVQIDVSIMLLQWCYFLYSLLIPTLELCMQKTWIMMWHREGSSPWVSLWASFASIL